MVSLTCPFWTNRNLYSKEGNTTPDSGGGKHALNMKLFLWTIWHIWPDDACMEYYGTSTEQPSTAGVNYAEIEKKQLVTLTV